MIRLTIIVLLITLEVYAQSPKFSFSKEFVKVRSTDQKNEISVFIGEYATKDELTTKKAILGNINQNSSYLTFTPLLPFQVNTTYTAVFNDDFFTFSIPLDANYNHLRVAEIYPKTSTLPSNFLKWYISFSTPVNPTHIYDHIRLINNTTKAKVDRAVLPLETPLLSDDSKLLTLWIEPGRQKRDLGPNTHLGEVLVEGESYTLAIDKNLKDTKGVPMNVDFKYSFRVIESDRTQPNIEQWRFILPKSNTKAPLIIHLNDVLDYGSLYHNLTIINNKGKVMDGVFAIETNKQQIVFTPSKYWNSDAYILKCNPLIEDISGNNLERLFDRDLQKGSKTPVLERKFYITN
ncbi:hypothetical protein [Tenacibaculum agarivorans]|uniref:hypothetical protein n=1 Tax=Tenacibaculum agarivorans TaxID=1908389 RepID=UPI000B18F438|nr:hypothetical protein [Tenacibaculum agarivorans]